jgi:hypothetical protein
MPSILNILAMHRSQQLAEELEADRLAQIQSRLMDVCSEICATFIDLHGEEEGNAHYQRWIAQAPDKGFINAAYTKLMSMKTGQPPEVNEANSFSNSFNFSTVKEVTI